MIIILYHAADRDLQPQLGKRLQSDINLPSSAVHHQKIGKSGKTSQLLIHALFFQLQRFLHPVGEPPGQHLFHGSVIVRPFHGLDPELPVIAALGLAVLIHDHGAYGFQTAGVGDIVSLHPPDMVQPNKTSDLVHGPDGPKLLPLDLLFILGQHKSRVFLRQLHQTFLLPLLRRHDLNLLPPLRRQPSGDDLALLRLDLHPQLPGDKRRPGIKLLHKAGKHLLIILLGPYGHMKMIPADDLALADKKDLHHRVRLVLCHGNDVPVLHGAAGDLLLLGHFLYAAKQLPVLDSFLKIHPLGSFFHLLFQHFQKLPVTPV